MSDTIKIKKGLDIQLVGEAEKNITAISSRTYASKPINFIGVFPKVLVQEGDEVKARVTFARDLLASNVECQELNELLDLAEVELDNQNLNAAANIVDSVINGCKYLIKSVKNVQEEQPEEISFVLFNLKESQVKIILIAIGVIIIFFLVSLFIMGKKKPIDEDI